MEGRSTSNGQTMSSATQEYRADNIFTKVYLRDSFRTTRTLKEHLNGETLPSVDNYQPPMMTGSRATLDELHFGEPKASVNGEVNESDKEGGGVKFGWIQGVLIRCLLNIWGVMLFLRLSWVVAEAGVGQAILIVLLATAVISLTTLSMSAISTNGQIKGGGTYYMISRSLGPEFGAAIGIIFALANAMAVALHTVGFCEALNDLLAEQGLQIVDGDLNDVRIIGSITLVVLGIIVGIGMEWEAKAQMLFMGILTVALTNFIVGSIIGPADIEEVSKGFFGYSSEILSINFESDYRIFDGIQQNFFSVFAIFFPAATGILAGANISGDLKDPSKAIPKGTLLAISITSSSYILFAVIAGATVLREATGNPANYTDVDIGNVSYYMGLCDEVDCEWGLHNSYQVMTLVSAVGPLNYAGCFAATLSSALACFVSAPKVFQALCRDRLFPYLHVFAKGYGKNQEPLRAYALTFVIALACVLIGRLNAIAPLITNCYLASYGLVNFSTFHVDLIQPLGWRPTFRYFNKWLSLLGFLLSVAAMFLCSWPMALVTTTCVTIFFMIVTYSKPDVNWGSSGQAQTYKTALITAQKFNKTEEHVKTYSPQVLVMTGLPNMRPSLVDFAYLLCKDNSLMVCGDILQERQSHKERSERVRTSTRWLRFHKTKAFYSLIDNMKFSDGVGALLQTTGIGRMRPNILLLGYKNDWQSSGIKEIDDYCAAINTALEMHVAVAVLRLPEGLDYTGIIGNFIDETLKLKNDTGIDNPVFNKLKGDIPVEQSSLGENNPSETSQSTKNSPSKVDRDTPNKKQKMKTSKITFKDQQGHDLPSEVQTSIYRFRLKQKPGTIDVWWLYDDGGLSLLLPYILTTRSNWANSKLRVFCLAENKEECQAKQESMKLLLKKFRIPVSDVILIPDIMSSPCSQTKSWFGSLTQDLVLVDGALICPTGPSISESELIAYKSKSFSYMRIRELLMQHSFEANLIVLTLPIFRKGAVSESLYMSWLETLTANMPPFLLVRGNHTSVLTFAS